MASLDNPLQASILEQKGTTIQMVVYAAIESSVKIANTEISEVAPPFHPPLSGRDRTVFLQTFLI